MSRFQRWFLWGSSVLTGLTGVVYWWMEHMLDPLDEWAVINHPLQPWVLKAHIVVAPVLVFAIGIITVDHIWKHFRNSVPRARRSGLTLLYILAPMIFSGYLIQAVTHAGWLTALVWVHVVTGVLYLLGLGVHRVPKNGAGNGNGGRPAESAQRTRRDEVAPGTVPADREATRVPTAPVPTAPVPTAQV